MVESILIKVFAKYDVPAATQRLLSHQIAKSLSDDAITGPRMEMLWDQLATLSDAKAD